ncbi:hypothetical protein E4U22_002229 [Claviceps purpurea]|nr:hypothetical protein E4U37_000058 [Claviceps purpurea]KAG6189209.1 hypothetical protein E4U36_005531 [Claviceps purpurea]KAG6201796.1 hypothetical protein E4U10_004806 [Claviceps purpurea]KAG6240631.1 hypothetical protein E4U25_007666 [Claviceps purpurea]KAG6281161.1 hypothetical protein E4U47_000023 [Claviceps purpurea]
MHALSLLALLLPLVAAAKHDQCDCMSWYQGGKWDHNRYLTKWICKYTDAYGPDKTRFDEHSGQCVGINGFQINGAEWEGNCKRVGVQGYYPIGMDGIIDISGGLKKIDEATGNC